MSKKLEKTLWILFVLLFLYLFWSLIDVNLHNLGESDLISEYNFFTIMLNDR